MSAHDYHHPTPARPMDTSLKLPVSEAMAKRRTNHAMEEWQESMQAQRRLVLLVTGFWLVVGAVVYFILHHSTFSLS